MTIGAEGGMSDSTRASVEEGSSSAPKLRKNDARMRIVSGAVTRLDLLLARHERAGDGERAAVEREAEQEPEQHDADRGDDVAVDVELARRQRR